MKKVTLLLLALTTYCGVSFAQSNFSFNIGVDGALPVGDLSDASKFGVGGTLKGFYGLTEESKLGLNVGYIHFPGKDNNDMIKVKSALIPILVDYRYHFQNLYVEPQAGVTVVTSKVKYDMDFGEGQMSGTEKSNTTAFGYAIGAGVMLNNLDISARYQGASKSGGTLSFIGLRVGYAF